MGHHQPGVGHVAPGHGAGAAVLAGPGLKPGGQRVAQAGGKEPPGGVGDDAGIDQNQIRVAAHEHGLDDHPGVVVEHGHAGAGRVVGGHGGDDDAGQAQIFGHGLGGVQGLSAAHAHHHVAALGPALVHLGKDLVLGGLAVEGGEHHLLLLLGQAGLHLGAEAPAAVVGADHQKLISQLLGAAAQVGQLSRALCIAGRGLDCVCHCTVSFLLGYRKASRSSRSAASTPSTNTCPRQAAMARSVFSSRRDTWISSVSPGRIFRRKVASRTPMNRGSFPA